VRLIPNKQRGGFTLIEVILAIGIAVGLLVVALHFYGQAADLRSRLLDETDRVSAVRLFLERLSTDLRAAYAQPQAGFSGESASLRFVVAGIPNRSGWSGTGRGRNTAGAIETDLTVVEYGTTRAAEGTNTVVTGLTRSERAFLELPAAVVLTPTNQATSLAAGTGTGPDGAAVLDARVPVIDSIHFVMYSFWDGSGWTDRWDASFLPECVEITLGAEPLPEGVDPLDYPYEIFRRVIYLPGSRAAVKNADPLADLFE
jgi:type II secretory pathway component PulJ